MCKVCRDVRKLAVVDALQLIGSEMAGANGHDREHLIELADSLTEADDEFIPEDPDLLREYLRRIQD